MTRPTFRTRIAVRRELPGFTLDAEFECGGGITALFGRSGAGKTTLVNLIAGLDVPDHGRIEINDQVLFDSDAGIDIPPERRRLGYVFQQPRLFPHYSVTGNLTYGMALVPPEQRTLGLDQVIALLGLETLLERRPHTLSGGEKQRVAIGRALLASPGLVLMDEPLANLDPERRGELLPFIESLRDDLNLPVFYVSHNADEIIRLADSAVLLDGGRVVASGPVEEVMSRLDLGPVGARDDPGAVLRATVRSHDTRYHLTELEVPGGTLWVAAIAAEPGSTLRVRILARDVAIALARPKDISTMNHFAGTVVEIHRLGNGAEANVLIALAGGEASLPGASLWSRITTRSLDDLGIEPGKEVFALVKAVAVDRSGLGRES